MTEIPEWLSDDARKIYLATLPHLKIVTPESLRMLAAYSDCLVHLHQLRHDADKARVWRGAMIYCRNGLGIGPRLFVDLMELILDSADQPELIQHLENAWQIERPVNYGTAPRNY